jgi:hypothetical protein
MSAREMQIFIHFFPLIIGDMVPENNEVWLFLLYFVEIIDLILLPTKQLFIYIFCIHLEIISYRKNVASYEINVSVNNANYILININELNSPPINIYILPSDETVTSHKIKMGSFSVHATRIVCPGTFHAAD